jgi:hypothetical protein
VTTATTPTAATGDAGDVLESAPELAFAARVPFPEPERPFPSARRAIFFDVENSSRAEHVSRVMDHLAVDRQGRATEIVAVGNWKVIGHDTARLLARQGAHLVHSAPSTGVRDWSDLRIAVSAGIWVAAARPGDILEIVSDDRAFDVVGDVAASLGIAFRRLSYRALADMPAEVAAVVEPRVSEPRSRRRRPRRRGRARTTPAPSHPVVVAPSPAVAAAHRTDQRSGSGAVGEPHTAPHDEIVAVVRDLLQASSGPVVSIDALANALKRKGFRRPPGSPRLITRLRRIKELAVSPAGMIALTAANDLPRGRENGADQPTPRAGGATGHPDEAAGHSADATAHPAEQAAHPFEPRAQAQTPGGHSEVPIGQPGQPREQSGQPSGQAGEERNAAAVNASTQRRRSRRGGRRRRRRGRETAIV